MRVMSNGSGPHPLVEQLRFARYEFRRGLRALPPELAVVRVGRMNSISWNVGHLAWQEQRYFVTVAQDETPHPELVARFAYGAPAETPPLDEVLVAWRDITTAADPWLDTLTSELLTAPVPARPSRTFGNLLQRTIYHYWFHNGENQGIRQQLETVRLQDFVGDIDGRAPYRPS